MWKIQGSAEVGNALLTITEWWGIVSPCPKEVCVIWAFGREQKQSIHERFLLHGYLPRIFHIYLKSRFSRMYMLHPNSNTAREETYHYQLQFDKLTYYRFFCCIRLLRTVVSCANKGVHILFLASCVFWFVFWTQAVISFWFLSP